MAAHALLVMLFDGSAARGCAACHDVLPHGCTWVCDVFACCARLHTVARRLLWLHRAMSLCMHAVPGTPALAP
eukprot:6568101-Alexandrium_andersonii.AAC.1